MRDWLWPEALWLYPVRGYAYKTRTFCGFARGLRACDCEADHDAMIAKRNRLKGFA